MKVYIEQLNDHIVHIVESESDEFLAVASKLESFKVILSDLKSAMKEFHKNFASEKERAEEVFLYLTSQYAELKAMVDEKKKLAYLVRLQEMYSEVELKVREVMTYLDVEECVRILVELK